MKYEITGLDVEIDIANAEPGKASIVTRFDSGTLTIVNTTEGRNTDIVVARPTVGIMWSAANVPSDIQAALKADNDEHCGVEFRGELYCTLGRVGFESTPEGTVLPPAGELELAAEPQPAGETGFIRQIIGIYDIAEEHAEELAAFLRSNAPDLIWVNSDVTQGRGMHPTWSCATGATSVGGRSPGAASGYLAILDGAGQALVEGGGIEFYRGDSGRSCAEG